ncbi:MAG: phosphatase PAP2 family protein [Moraxellaceae bacterium]
MNKTRTENPSFNNRLARMEWLEYRLCVRINRSSRREAVRLFFKAISRLGDGVFWYSLMAALVIVQGEAGRLAVLQMLLTSGMGLALYKYLKENLVRERPFIAHADISCGCPPLDRYSFPSGHTLQAVLFTTLAVSWFPMLAMLLIPFTLLVALSRMVLGLHYPTDVVCGALIGFGLAQSALWLLPAI